jgi:hypothetical protein
MLHGLLFVLSLIAALSLVAGVIRVLFGPRQSPRSGSRFGHAVHNTLEQYVRANRYTTDVMFSTSNSPSAAQEGWSLIDRNLRARRAVRLAVR